MKNIIRNFIIFLCVFSVLILTIGIFEVVRDDYIYDIIETNLINAENTPSDILDDYLDFRNHYLFSNDIFLDILNFLGWIGIFFIFVSAWRDGWSSPLKRMENIFISYSLLFIILIYIFIIIFNYLVNIFINQIIVILFNDIYSSIFIFKLFIDYFIPLFLITNLIYFIANQLKNYSAIE